MFSWEIYEYFRSNHRMCFIKKLFLKISQYSLESCRPASLLETDSNTGVFDQVYSNTRVPTQVNTNQTRVKTSPTRIWNKSTRINTSLKRVNTSPTQVNTNKQESKIILDEHKSDTSLTQVNLSQLTFNF